MRLGGTRHNEVSLDNNREKKQKISDKTDERRKDELKGLHEDYMR